MRINRISINIRVEHDHFNLYPKIGIMSRRIILKSFQIQGIACLFLGIFCNKFVIEAIFSKDGTISALSIQIGLIFLQVLLIIAGILYLRQAYRWLTRIGMIFLFFFVFQFWVRILIDIPFAEQRMFEALPKPTSLFKTKGKYHNQISLYEEQLLELTPYLPKSGAIGFIADPQLAPEMIKFYIGLTAYVLAPLKIEESTSHQFIIGIFPLSDIHPLILDTNNFIILKHVEYRIILFKRNDL